MVKRSGTGTRDHTLRRGCTFEFGSMDFFVWEWTPHDADDFSDLGQHTNEDCPTIDLDYLSGEDSESEEGE